jgi:hypothetical protein
LFFSDPCLLFLVLSDPLLLLLVLFDPSLTFAVLSYAFRFSPAFPCSPLLSFSLMSYFFLFAHLRDTLLAPQWASQNIAHVAAPGKAAPWTNIAAVECDQADDRVDPGVRDRRWRGAG